MRRLLLIYTIFSALIFANIKDSEIANLFILGFYGTSSSDAVIKDDICKKGLGGVILFQKSPVARGSAKNFSSAVGLRALTSDLKSCGTKPLIAVDQEGGVVQRVRFSTRYPSAIKVAQSGEAYASKIYSAMASELHNLGVNLNFGPVADLALNPNNRVIVKWGRSFGKEASQVVKYDTIFINAMHRYGVAVSLKHFPGHGSSLGDTHKGFVDVTNLWQEIELEPYKSLKSKADTVMVAHIFNRRLDANYPASLSRNVVTGLLRNRLGYSGVVISDDMQMGAIRKHYSLKETVRLALNAGVDMVLFANQVAPKRVITVDRLVKVTRELLKEGAVSEATIKAANRRINRLKSRLY